MGHNVNLVTLIFRKTNGAGAGLRTRELLRDRILSPAPLTKLGCGVYDTVETPAA
jgi:hypothetical protein